MSIKGSSDSSIPSVNWPGRNSNFFSTSALLGTALSIVNTPSSTTLRSFGQGIVGSFVESSAPASCALKLPSTTVYGGTPLERRRPCGSYGKSGRSQKRRWQVLRYPGQSDL